MTKRRLVPALAVVLACVACISNGPPLVKCPVTAFDPTVPPETKESATKAGFTVLPCTSGEYAMVLTGTKTLGDEEMKSLQVRAKEALEKIEGVGSVGVGVCCMADGRSSDRTCLRVHVEQGTMGITAVPGIVAGLRPADATLAVAIVQAPQRAPRCGPKDPTCGPIPYDAHACVDGSATKDWGRERVLPSHGSDSQPDPCDSDGDCVSCNTVCRSYRYLESSCNDLLSTRLKNAYCGCLDRGCAWFEMKR